MDAPRRRINRNIVECKVELMMNAAKEYIVLIETSWNVKTHLRKFKDDIRHRINRNIVECKEQ